MLPLARSSLILWAAQSSFTHSVRLPDVVAHPGHSSQQSVTESSLAESGDCIICLEGVHRKEEETQIGTNSVSSCPTCRSAQFHNRCLVEWGRSQAVIRRMRGRLVRPTQQRMAREAFPDVSETVARRSCVAYLCDTCPNQVLEPCELSGCSYAFGYRSDKLIHATCPVCRDSAPKIEVQDHVVKSKCLALMDGFRYAGPTIAYCTCCCPFATCLGVCWVGHYRGDPETAMSPWLMPEACQRRDAEIF